MAISEIRITADKKDIRALQELQHALYKAHLRADRALETYSKYVDKREKKKAKQKAD